MPRVIPIVAALPVLSLGCFQENLGPRTRGVGLGFLGIQGANDPIHS